MTESANNELLSQITDIPPTSTDTEAALDAKLNHYLNTMVDSISASSTESMAGFGIFFTPMSAASAIPDVKPFEIIIPKKEVNLSYRNLTAIPLDIPEDTEVLRLDNNQLTSLAGIERLTKLEQLHCSYNQLHNLRSLSGLDKLQILVCDHNPTLNDLSQLPLHLQSLSLKHCQLTDGTMWSLLNVSHQLKNLYMIDLSDNQITNIAGIPTGVLSLVIAGNQLARFSLSDHLYFTRLIVFDCSRNQLTELCLDPSDIWLYKLDCQNNPQLMACEYFPQHLRMLSIGGTAIGRLVQLPAYLESLNIQGRTPMAGLHLQLNNLQYLTSLTIFGALTAANGQLAGRFPALHPKVQLKSLTCINNGLTHLPDLTYQRELTSLNVSGSPALQSSLGPFPPNLAEISVVNCQGVERVVGSLPPALKKLTLAISSISQLPSLSHCYSLQELVVAVNVRLTELPQLPSSLVKLICSKCPNLTWLPNLPPYLSYLDCSNCGIVDLPLLPDLASVGIRGTLNIACNQLGTGESGNIGMLNWQRILNYPNPQYSPQLQGPLKSPLPDNSCASRN